MKSVLRYIICILIVQSGVRAMAQVDPHFSQYFIQPMTLNPALTGAIEGDYRVSAVWRSQYQNTLSTAGISAEMITNKNVNLGINILNQSSSDKSYNFSNAYLSAAYTGARFGNHYLVMAMQAGFINRRFNVSKLQFGDQWVSGLGYDHNITTGDVLNQPSVFTFDAGAGALYYDATPDKKINLFAGFSAYHLSQPKDPFITGGDKHALPIRYSAHAGARIIVNEFFNIVPNVLYMQQGNNQEKMAGAYLQINASQNVDLMIGANIRFKDAISPFAGFYYKGLTVGMSYDTGISTKEIMTINRNSVELSISYTWWRKKSMQTKPFFCPRF